VFKRYKVPETRLQNTESFDTKQNDKPTSPQPIESLSKTKIIFTVLISMSLCFIRNEMNYFATAPHTTSSYQSVYRHNSGRFDDFMTQPMLRATVSAYISSKISPEVMLSYHLIINTYPWAFTFWTTLYDIHMDRQCIDW